MLPKKKKMDGWGDNHGRKKQHQSLVTLKHSIKDLTHSNSFTICLLTGGIFISILSTWYSFYPGMDIFPDYYNFYVHENELASDTLELNPVTLYLLCFFPRKPQLTAFIWLNICLTHNFVFKRLRVTRYHLRIHCVPQLG